MADELIPVSRQALVVHPPASRAEIVKAVSVLLGSCSIGPGIHDPAAFAKAMVQDLELKAYSLDIIRQAVRVWRMTQPWAPAISQIIELCDRLLGPPAPRAPRGPPPKDLFGSADHDPRIELKRQHEAMLDAKHATWLEEQRREAALRAERKAAMPTSQPRRAPVTPTARRSRSAEPPAVSAAAVAELAAVREILNRQFEEEWAA
jgi:hypothetical protein